MAAPGAACGPRPRDGVHGHGRDEPAPGVANRTVTVAGSLGYTPEQAEAERRLHKQLPALSEQIVTHGF